MEHLRLAQLAPSLARSLGAAGSPERYSWRCTKCGRSLTAELGAASVLARLIFGGVSINLRTILEAPQLPSRALEALLIVTSLLLVPGQTTGMIGYEILIIGIVAWATIAVVDVRICAAPRSHIAT